VPEIDAFARQLLEEAKRFLERARESKEDVSAKDANLHAALMLTFCALEAHFNAAASDFAGRSDLSPHDRSVLFEQEVRLESGKFVLKADRLKMIRLEDRLLFLYQRVSGRSVDRKESWWSGLIEAIHLRNQLTHPKKVPTITIGAVERAVRATIDTIDAMYQAIYNEKFPAAARDLESRLTF
jgi:hypothetical protein